MPRGTLGLQHLPGVPLTLLWPPDQQLNPPPHMTTHLPLNTHVPHTNSSSSSHPCLLPRQVLRPELRLLLLRRTARRGGGSSGVGGREFAYVDLPWRHSGGQSPLWLGVPTVVTHVADEHSPLKGMGPAEIERRGWEIVVLLDGTDESTSMPVQVGGLSFAQMMRLGLPEPVKRLQPHSVSQQECGCLSSTWR